MSVKVSLCLALLLAGGHVVAQDDAGRSAVSALGRLEPENGIITVGVPSTPDATSGSILAELLVEEGEDVRQGQLLAIMDTAALMKARVEEARAELEFSHREVEAARSNADEACVRAEVAEREAQRRVRLHAEGVTGEEEADRAKGEADARAASCTSARTTVHLFQSGEEVARARVNRVLAELQRSYIKAPIDARVIHVIARPGERIGPEGIFELGTINSMYAIAEVYETDVRHVKQGQRVTVRSSALPEDLSGKVTHVRQKVEKQDEIGTDPAARKDARIVEVVIRLDDSKAAEGLTNLQVDVLIHR